MWHVCTGDAFKNRLDVKLQITIRGFAKNFPPKNPIYCYGIGWVGTGLTWILFFLNRPKIALNQYWYFGVVYHVYSVYIYFANRCWLL